MSWAHDSGGTASSASLITSLSAAVGSAVSAAELIAASYAIDNANGATSGVVSDQLGNSYSKPSGAVATDSANQVILEGQLSIATVTGTPTVKVQFNPTPGTTQSALTSLAVDTLTGSDASSAADGPGSGQHQATPTTTTDALSSGSWSTGTDGDVLFSATLDSAAGTNPGTAGTGFTPGQTTGGGVLKTEWMVQATHSATTAATWTALLNEDHVTIAFAVKPAAAGGSTQIPRMPPQMDPQTNAVQRQ